MNIEYFIERLAASRQVIQALIAGVNPKQARWKPSPEKWSIIEVINHLSDEERDDFRQRLNLVLTDPDETWPPIDPQNWASTRRYNESDLNQSVGEFLVEREESVNWLRQLTVPNWQNAYKHPDGRTVTAGDLIASWLAHDYLHVRQLARLHWQYVEIVADPYLTAYGGPWKES